MYLWVIVRGCKIMTWCIGCLEKEIAGSELVTYSYYDVANSFSRNYCNDHNGVYIK